MVLQLLQKRIGNVQGMGPVCPTEFLVKREGNGKFSIVPVSDEITPVGRITKGRITKGRALL